MATVVDELHTMFASIIDTFTALLPTLVAGTPWPRGHRRAR